ncbi:MAG: hypothetical protein AB8U60_01200 [Rickettsia conorii subsp. raoultii]
MRGKTVSFDEAISGHNPEIATLPMVARNDDFHNPYYLTPK